MWRFLILMVFSLVAGCADTPDRVESTSAMTEPDCPPGKILFVEDDHYYCVDERVFEPEDCWPCARTRDWFND
jgi:hypothetical protein